jgi:flagellar hook assembly protein FlgD
MLVTQLQNQDPLNPMDNAQITSQMAQINAVTGLDKVNTSVQALGAQFLQMQAMQGAALVGRDVAFEGNSVTVRDGVGRGAVELASAASSTRVEVLDGSGKVVGTVDLGTEGRRPPQLRMAGRQQAGRCGLHASASRPRWARRPWPAARWMSTACSRSAPPATR